LGRWLARKRCTKISSPCSVRDLAIATVSLLRVGPSEMPMSTVSEFDKTLLDAIVPFTTNEFHNVADDVDPQVLTAKAARTAHCIRQLQSVKWTTAQWHGFLLSQASRTEVLVDTLALLCALEQQGIITTDGDGRIAYGSVLHIMESDVLNVSEAHCIEVPGTSLVGLGEDGRKTVRKWLLSFGCRCSQSPRGLVVEMDTIRVTVPMANLFTKSLPKVLRLALSNRPLLIAQSLVSKSMRGALLGNDGAELRALEKKFGLNIVIKGEQVLCWMSLRRLPQGLNMLTAKSINALKGKVKDALLAFEIELREILARKYAECDEVRRTCSRIQKAPQRKKLDRKLEICNRNKKKYQRLTHEAVKENRLKAAKQHIRGGRHKMHELEAADYEVEW